MSAEPTPSPQGTDVRTRLRRRARQLAGQGLGAEQIAAQLEAEIPGLRYSDGPEWRRDAEYNNPAQAAVMERSRGRLPGQHTEGSPALRVVPTPPHAPPSMGEAVRALAALNNHTCIYCGRKGTAQGDADGQPWQRDLVPTTFGDVTAAAGSFVLSCTACKARPGRFSELGGVEI